MIKEEATIDAECISLTNQIQQGFPHAREELPAVLRPYWTMKDNLYVVDNVPFKENKMLIPMKLRKIVLEGLHSAHQGVIGMLSNARSRFFWPGLDAAVRLTRVDNTTNRPHHNQSSTLSQHLFRKPPLSKLLWTCSTSPGTCTLSMPTAIQVG